MFNRPGVNGKDRFKQNKTIPGAARTVKRVAGRFSKEGAVQGAPAAASPARSR
jgi:hypothetical protein